MPKTLFVTPDYTSDVYQCRTLETPNNLEWLGVFNKALLLMLDPWNWEQINDTDLTVDETITLVTSILNQFWATENCGDGDGCMLPELDSPPFRLGVNGRFEMLDPETGEWGPPTGEYEIPPVGERDETTAYDRRCAAAANAANVMNQLYEAITDEIALGGDALQVAAAMVAALVSAVGGWIAAPVYAIIQLTIALFVGMVELLQVLGGDVWTTEFNDKLKCAFFECATSTGDVVTFDLACIREKLNEPPDLLNPTWFYELQLFAQIMYLLELITMDGLNAAGTTTAITDAECDDCEGWCYEIDFELTNGGWGQVSPGTSGLYGTYSSGNGWTTTDAVDTVPNPDVFNRMFYVGQTLATSATFTHVEIDLNYTKGSFFNNRRAQGVEIGIGYATTIIDINSTPASNGAPLTLSWDGSIVSNSIVVFARSSAVTGSGVYSGSAVLKRILIRGTGQNPFSEDNCE